MRLCDRDVFRVDDVDGVDSARDGGHSDQHLRQINLSYLPGGADHPRLMRDSLVCPQTAS